MFHLQALKFRKTCTFPEIEANFIDTGTLIDTLNVPFYTVLKRDITILCEPMVRT